METDTTNHPDHPVPEDVAKGIDAVRNQRWRQADRQFEFARAARPSEEERRFKAELKENMLASAGTDVTRFHEKRANLRKGHFDRLLEHIKRPLDDQVFDLPDLDWKPAAPVQTDPSFWFAQANWFGDSPYTGSFDSDGVSFRGMKNHDSGNLIKLRFGLTTKYELHANRIPPSGSGRWRSAPHVEIFGSLIGSSQDSFGWGDDWCKCWMILRQTAYQFVFAPPGADNRHIIGTREEAQTIFFSEDAPFTQFKNFSGFQPLPGLVLTHPFPAQSIWVETEVRFDIQLEGSAQLWIDPQRRFVIRNFQWPAEPV